MPILRVEHPVRDFDAWKAAFDGDPIGRENVGVRRYRIFRPDDDPHYVLLDLEFDTAGEAEAFRKALERLWQRAVSEGLIERPHARIVDEFETREY
jgi:hypothetical protein